MGKRIHDTSNSASEEELDFTIRDTSDEEQHTEDLEPFEQQFLAIRRKNLKPIEPLYESDTSDDEFTNTIGNVPPEWYDDFPHIGYNINGDKIDRPAAGDTLDNFLSQMDDPDSWKSVLDRVEGRQVVLSPDELNLLQHIQQRRFPADFDAHAKTIEWFSSVTEKMPLTGAPEPKRRFVPSKHEGRRIMQIARAIQLGLIKKKEKKKEKDLFDLWANEQPLPQSHISAPKMALPDHIESYNPPQEYLLTPKEDKEWRDMDPEDRPFNFFPQKFESLRHVPAYDNFIQERFERCLDLYLCPRTIKQKLNIDPESLIPQLPSPKDLHPFPTKLSITYKGHKALIRSFGVDPTGQWLASGSDDNTVKIWEITSGRNIRTFEFDQKVMCVSWNPNNSLSILAVVSDNRLTLLDPQICNNDIRESTKDYIQNSIKQIKNECSAKWAKPNDDEASCGHYLHIDTIKKISNVIWHRKGDYFATVCPEADSSSVLIHQLTKASSQSPFKKSPGIVQKVLFHPLKPFLFVATQKSIRVYNLVKQTLIKKLLPGAKWISSIDVHPQGDNLIVGTFDKRIHWFDMDLSTKPYKTLRYHRQAVRQVCYHKTLPLFASCGDDAKVLIFHCKVSDDLMTNPQIVPVKTLEGAKVVDNIGLVDIEFHPVLPWLFSAGSDGEIRLYV